jgi:1-acyl-sn-glycerol-3-phosphate acyltransferase
MADNGSGTANEYDKSSFKQLLKQCKESIANGFDIGLLPEGQLNPTPQLGLLPIFGGAQFLAKLAKRPIQFMAMHGANHLWHSSPDIGMRILGRNVKAQIYC